MLTMLSFYWHPTVAGFWIMLFAVGCHILVRLRRDYDNRVRMGNDSDSSHVRSL